MTTVTSSQVSVIAFADELVKIAGASLAPTRKEKLKRWLKDAGIVAAGTGVGTGAYMLSEKAIAPKLGPKWNSLRPATRRSVAGAGAAAATMGGLVLAHKVMKERQKSE